MPGGGCGSRGPPASGFSYLLCAGEYSWFSGNTSMLMKTRDYQGHYTSSPSEVPHISLLLSPASSTRVSGMLLLPLVIQLLIFGKISGSNSWLVNRPEIILFHTVPRTYRQMSLLLGGLCISWTFSPETYLICMSFYFAVPSTLIPLGNCPPLLQEIWVVSHQGYSIKGGTPSLSIFWSIGYGYLLSLSLIHNVIKCWVCAAESSLMSSSADTHTSGRLYGGGDTVDWQARGDGGSGWKDGGRHVVEGAWFCQW